MRGAAGTEIGIFHIRPAMYLPLTVHIGCPAMGEPAIVTIGGNPVTVRIGLRNSQVTILRQQDGETLLLGFGQIYIGIAHVTQLVTSYIPAQILIRVILINETAVFLVNDDTGKRTAAVRKGRSRSPIRASCIGIQIQTSEITKIAVIVFFASLLSQKKYEQKLQKSYI